MIRFQISTYFNGHNMRFRQHRPDGPVSLECSCGERNIFTGIGHALTYGYKKRNVTAVEMGRKFNHAFIREEAID